MVGVSRCAPPGPFLGARTAVSAQSSANRTELADMAVRAPSRRNFLKTLGTMGAGLALCSTVLAENESAPPKKKIKLGLDNFAVRAMNWKAHALLDYAASLKLDSILISDLDALENHEPAYLREVKAKAADL